MVQWIRLTEKQYLGFWVIGILLFALQEVPYMVMPWLKLKTNPIMNMAESSIFLNACEKILGISCIFMMMFLVNKDVGMLDIGGAGSRVGFIIAIFALSLNYFGWLLYFNGHQSIVIMMVFLVALPPLYYACIGLWRRNWLLSITGIAFLIVHFTHVLGNLKT